MNLSIEPSYSIISVILFFSILILFFSYHKSIKRNGIKLLVLIRTIILLFFLTLFINPTLEINKQINKELPWHIYIDKSLSLNYYKQPSYNSYIKGISNFIQRLKKTLPEKNIIFPNLDYCTDNAAMISYLGEIKFNLGKKSNLNFGITPNSQI